MSKLRGKFLTDRSFVLLTFLSFIFLHSSHAQTTSWPAFAGYTFYTGVPDAQCGPPVHIYGYGVPASMFFSFDSYLSGGNFSWEMDDDWGALASGGYYNGYSTGGTSSSSASFSFLRIPVGDVSFYIHGSYTLSSGVSGGPCTFGGSGYAGDGPTAPVVLSFQDNNYKIQLRDQPTAFLQSGGKSPDGSVLVITGPDSPSTDVWHVMRAVNGSNISGLLPWSRFFLTDASSLKSINEGSDQTLVSSTPDATSSYDAHYRLVSAGDGSFYIGSYYSSPAGSPPNTQPSSNTLLTGYSTSGEVTYNFASTGLQNWIFVRQ